MKEVDDTPVHESESEKKIQDWIDDRARHSQYFRDLRAFVDALEKRVANLESRKPPQDINPDPEWYS